MTKTLWAYKNDAGGASAFGASAWGSASFAVVFEPRDLWIGVYHERLICGSHDGRGRRFYVCLVPTLVFRFEVSLYSRTLRKRRWALGWGVFGRRKRGAA